MEVDNMSGITEWLLPTRDNNTLISFTVLMRQSECTRYLPQVHQISNLLFITVPVFTVVLQDEVLAKTNTSTHQWFLCSLMVRVHLRSAPHDLC